jgi:hypothetical protein
MRVWALVALVAFSGCIEAAAPPETQTPGARTSEPAALAGRENHSLPAAPGLGGGANLTGCSAQLASIQAPTVFVSQMVPSAYTIIESTPGTSLVAIEARKCAKVAVHGRDVGPGTLQITSVAIWPPDENAPTGGALFGFEFRTSIPELETYVASAGIDAKKANNELSEQALSDALNYVTTAVTDDRGAIYRWDAVTVTPTWTVSGSLRYFFGETPTDVWLDEEFNLTQSAQIGGAEVSLREDTAASRATGGAPSVLASANSYRNQSGLMLVRTSD